MQSAKASVARRGNQKFQHLCASIPITASEQKLAAAGAGYFLYAYSYNIRINTFICLHEDPVSVFVQKYRLLEGKLQAS